MLVDREFSLCADQTLWITIFLFYFFAHVTRVIRQVERLFARLKIKFNNWYSSYSLQQVHINLWFVCVQIEVALTLITRKFCDRSISHKHNSGKWIKARIAKLHILYAAHMQCEVKGRKLKSNSLLNSYLFDGFLSHSLSTAFNTQDHKQNRKKKTFNKRRACILNHSIGTWNYFYAFSDASAKS